MKTISVSIGNSDNKLTQVEWNEFVNDVDKSIRACALAVHFFGGASNWMPWQNVAWLFDCNDTQIERLKTHLKICKADYRQDSIAMLEGDTQFV